MAVAWFALVVAGAATGLTGSVDGQAACADLTFYPEQAANSSLQPETGAYRARILFNWTNNDCSINACAQQGRPEYVTFRLLSKPGYANTTLEPTKAPLSDPAMLPFQGPRRAWTNLTITTNRSASGAPEGDYAFAAGGCGIADATGEVQVPNGVLVTEAVSTSGLGPADAVRFGGRGAVPAIGPVATAATIAILARLSAGRRR